MFLDCLELIFSSLEAVVKALDVDIFTVGTVGVSFWELILGLLVLGIIFGFFLAPRYGSGLAGIGNINEHQNAQREKAERNAERQRQAQEKAFNDSYAGYFLNRFKRESYAYQYNQDLNKNALKGKRNGK